MSFLTLHKASRGFRTSTSITVIYGKQIEGEIDDSGLTGTISDVDGLEGVLNDE